MCTTCAHSEQCVDTCQVSWQQKWFGIPIFARFWCRFRQTNLKTHRCRTLGRVRVHCRKHHEGHYVAEEDVQGLPEGPTQGQKLRHLQICKCGTVPPLPAKNCVSCHSVVYITTLCSLTLLSWMLSCLCCRTHATNSAKDSAPAPHSTASPPNNKPEHLNPG